MAHGEPICSPNETRFALPPPCHGQQPKAFEFASLIARLRHVTAYG